MFDFVGKHKRLLQFFLALVIVPTFALWGIQSYDRLFTSGGAVAEVAGEPISGQEFERALERQREQMRQVLGKDFDPSLLDSVAARKELLNGLIAQRVLMNYGVKNKLFVSDAALREVIASFDAFHEDGKFSRTQYEGMLRAQNMTPAMFEAQLRGDLMLQQIASGLVESGFVAKTSARQFAALRGETREIAQVAFPASQFAAQAKVTPEAIEAYYRENSRQFEVPEQIRVEYVSLTPDALAANDPVSAEEVKAYYDANIAPRFKEREAARGKAEALLAQVRKDPSKFAELAKVSSQDPGSAAEGGDLGFFGRGAMVKPFEDAVFKLKPNEVSPLVETEFGFHIIQLTEIRPAGKAGGAGEERRARHILITAPAQAKDFSGARADIEGELRRQRVAKRFPEAADELQNLVYEQPDSLQPAADRFKLTIEQSGWITRKGGPAPFSNPRLLAALFTDDVIKNKRNAEAVEVAPGRVVAARLIEHKPASVLPLAEVRSDIEKQLVSEAAQKLAVAAGAANLAALNEGKDLRLEWSPVRTVSRENPAGLDPRAVAPIFRLSAAKLPAYVGVDIQPAGYVIFRISKVTEAAKLDEARLRASEAGLARQQSRDAYQAFVTGLREKAKVEIHEANLVRKEN